MKALKVLKELWLMRVVGGKVEAGVFEKLADMKLAKDFELSDLPKDLISLDDLERFGINLIHRVV